MKIVALTLLLHLMESSHAQTTINSESTTASLNCPAPKQLVHDDDGFAVQHNQNVVHIYAVQSNSYLVLNSETNIFIVIDGTNETFFICEADTGFAGIFNPSTNLDYVVTNNLKQFDISKVFQGNFAITANLTDYALLHTDKVVGSDIDTTQPGYVNTTTLLQDYATTINFKKWVNYASANGGNTSHWNDQIKTARIMNKVLQSNAGYSAQWGVVMFYVVTSEQYKKEEECQTAYIDVMMRVIRDHNAAFDSTLMNKLYNIVSRQKNMTKEEAIQNYEALLANNGNLS